MEHGYLVSLKRGKRRRKSSYQTRADSQPDPYIDQRSNDTLPSFPPLSKVLLLVITVTLRIDMCCDAMRCDVYVCE